MSSMRSSSSIDPRFLTNYDQFRESQGGFSSISERKGGGDREEDEIIEAIAEYDIEETENAKAKAIYDSNQEIKDDIVIKAFSSTDIQLSNVSSPPDMKIIVARWITAFKENTDPKFPVVFATAMALQGFRADKVRMTVSINYKGKVIKLKEALREDFKFDRLKNCKGPHAISPRRVCMAFALPIRKYLETQSIGSKKFVTSMQKRYLSNETYLFIGGQSTITSNSEAKRYTELIAMHEGPVARDKAIKYFFAKGIMAI